MAGSLELAHPVPGWAPERSWRGSERPGASSARPSFIVSHRVGLDEAPEAYRRFDQRRDGYTKVILKPGNEAEARA